MVTDTTENTQAAPPDILTLWALYLQERRRSLLTELKVIEKQQEELRAWQGQPPTPATKQR